MTQQRHDDDFSSTPAIAILMMPRDTNPAGTIFGGVILSHIDQAGAEAALLHGAKNVVTVAMKEVVFLKPVYVGDRVSFFVKVIRKGRTSITVKVKVEAARRYSRRKIALVTEAEITYVNVNSDREPIPFDQNDR